MMKRYAIKLKNWPRNSIVQVRHIRSTSPRAFWVGMASDFCFNSVQYKICQPTQISRLCIQCIRYHAVSLCYRTYNHAVESISEAAKRLIGLDPDMLDNLREQQGEICSTPRYPRIASRCQSTTEPRLGPAARLISPFFSNPLIPLSNTNS